MKVIVTWASVAHSRWDGGLRAASPYRVKGEAPWQVEGGSPIGSRVKRLAQLELAFAPIRTGYYLTQAPQVRQLRSPPASPEIGKKERGILD